MAPITRGNSLYTIVENTSGGWGANGWTNTREKAKAIGGDLVVFETRAEQDDVYILLPYIHGGGQGLAIGMTISDGTARWISGSSLNYSHWGNWNPSNTLNGYVGILAAYSGGGERFWDASKDGSWGWNGLAEIPLVSSITFSTTPKEGAGVFTTSINLSAGNQSTGNLANGATVYWTVSGITADDLASGALTGSGTITNGKLDIQHSLKVDADTGEQFQVSVFSDSARSQQIGTQMSINIQESQTTPAPTYSLSTSASSINEGSTLTTTVSTTNVNAGTTLYYSLSGTGITTADFSSGSLRGSGVLSNSGSFSFSHALASDLTTEGTETLNIKLFSDSARTTQVGSTVSVTINDTSTTPANSVSIGRDNNGIANNGDLTNNGNINQFNNNGPVNTGTITSNSNNGNTINSNNNSGNTFTTNSNNGNTVNSNNGNTTTVVNNIYNIINSFVNSNNQTTNTNSGNIGSTIGSFNTQNTINQTYVSKSSTDYKIVRIADNRYGIKLPDSNTVDEITGQRYVPFADKAIDLQRDVKGVFDQVTGKETSDAKIFRLYNAAFARTPDADGLKFWINSYSSGAIDYKQVAQSFLSSPEFASKYGVNNSNNDFVNNLYKNILGRSPDSSGLQFWVNTLNRGVSSRADVLGGFSESPENKNLFSQTTGFT